MNKGGGNLFCNEIENDYRNLNHGAALLCECLLGCSKVMNSNRTKIQIGCRIVTLQADVAGGQPLTLARILVGFSCVLPIDDLVAVDPCCKSVLLSDQRGSQPFTVVGNDVASCRAAENGSGSRVRWFRSSSG